MDLQDYLLKHEIEAVGEAKVFSQPHSGRLVEAGTFADSLSNIESCLKPLEARHGASWDRDQA
jgi:hypothetical protein